MNSARVAPGAEGRARTSVGLCMCALSSSIGLSVCVVTGEASSYRAESDDSWTDTASVTVDRNAEESICPV